MNILPILICIIFILYILLFVIYYKKYIKNEKYNISTFPFSGGYNRRKQNKALTPLKPLISPLKKYALNNKLPYIYIYNPKYFSPVRDQGICGDCWALTICSLLSDNVTRKIFKFGKNLSVQQLLSCYPSGTDPCDGQVPEDVLIWLEKTGFKLSISDAISLSTCVPTDVGIDVEKNSVNSLCDPIVRESIENPTPEETTLINENIYNMKMQLMTNGSFFGTISVYDDFIHFKGDKVYIKSSNDFIGGHAITVIGWVDKGVDLREGFEVGYWVCKNSWDTSWAKLYDFPGYFAVKMGSNECGIESRAGCASANVGHISEDETLIPKYLVINTYSGLLKITNEAKH